MGSGRKDPDWLAGVPLWTLVEQQGGRASTFFWPESDAPFDNTLPTDYRAYDGRVPHTERVKQVVEWLSLPAGQRPDLVTLYFSAVDSAGHTYGPDAPETLAAIADVDDHIATLWRAIAALNGRGDGEINLLLVSDHGMAEVDPDAFIDTNTLPRPRGFKRVNGSTRVTYYQRDPDADIEALAMTLEDGAADTGVSPPLCCLTATLITIRRWGTSPSRRRHRGSFAVGAEKAPICVACMAIPLRRRIWPPFWSQWDPRLSKGESSPRRISWMCIRSQQQSWIWRCPATLRVMAAGSEQRSSTPKLTEASRSIPHSARRGIQSALQAH